MASDDTLAVEVRQAGAIVEMITRKLAYTSQGGVVYSNIRYKGKLYPLEGEDDGTPFISIDDK